MFFKVKFGVDSFCLICYFIMNCFSFSLIYIILYIYIYMYDFPDGASGKEPTCQCRRRQRCRFDPRVTKVPWRRARQHSSILAQKKPMDTVTWPVTVHRFTKSRTQLKWLSVCIYMCIYIYFGEVYMQVIVSMGLNRIGDCWRGQ